MDVNKPSSSNDFHGKQILVPALIIRSHDRFRTRMGLDCVHMHCQIASEQTRLNLSILDKS